MKKLTFIEKNDALVSLKNLEHFEADCLLLQKVNPTSPIHNEIAQVNDFNKESIGSRIILNLLDFVTIEEIEANRIPAGETKPEEGAESKSKDDTSAEETKPAGEPKPLEEVATQKKRNKKSSQI